eukprot:3989983-Amphidinium_carterae.1
MIDHDCTRYSTLNAVRPGRRPLESSSRQGLTQPLQWTAHACLRELTRPVQEQIKASCGEGSKGRSEEAQQTLPAESLMPATHRSQYCANRKKHGDEHDGKSLLERSRYGARYSNLQLILLRPCLKGIPTSIQL